MQKLLIWSDSQVWSFLKWSRQLQPGNPGTIRLSSESFKYIYYSRTHDTLQSSRIVWTSSARLLDSCIDLKHSSSIPDLSMTWQWRQPEELYLWQCLLFLSRSQLTKFFMSGKTFYYVIFYIYWPCITWYNHVVEILFFY